MNFKSVESRKAWVIINKLGLKYLPKKHITSLCSFGNLFRGIILTYNPKNSKWTLTHIRA